MVSKNCKQTHFLGKKCSCRWEVDGRSCLENLKAAQETVFIKHVLPLTKMPGSDLHIM